MKTAKIRFKKGLLFATALTCLALAVAAPAQVSGYKDGYCELRLTGCPQDYDSVALSVPLNVVALSTHVRACGRQDEIATIEGPAVMFVIDHSSSMDQNNVNNDANGNRFRVTRALIDSIYAKAPNAEVGVVLFANGLVFNVDRDANLVLFQGTINPKAPPGLSNQAYMPLLQLDQPAKTGGTSPFYSGAAVPKAIDVYRSMFTTPANVNQKSSITGGPITQSGTDISIAFEAALEAFKTTKKPKANQYIIFLSDGAPGLRSTAVTGQRDSVGCPDTLGTPSQYNPRCALLNRFSTETNGVPTTYTVFLQLGATANSTPPSIIQTMTENVKKNGYSATNPNSNAWALESNFNNLLNLMMKEIISPMLKKADASAKSIVISSSSVSGVFDSTGTMDGNFNFKRQLPLDTAEITTVKMGIRYDVQIDSITSAGDTIKHTVPDSLFNYTFSVRRSANPPGNWLASQNLDTECKNAPSLDLRFDGKTLVGKEVKGNMDVLQIVFDNTGGLFTYNTVKIQVLNADGSVSDLEEFTLTKGNDGKWTYQFPRTVSETASKGDGKLQHTAQDSIILVFRNPDVPLDTIRVAVPYVSNDMAFHKVPGAPTDATLLPDKIDVIAGETLDIYAKLFDNNHNWDEAMTNSGKIKWTVTPAIVLTTDGAHSVFRNETAGGTYTVTATYTDGPLVIKHDITIRVVPGPAKYLEAVTDSAKINYGRLADTSYLKRNKEYEFNKDVEYAVFYAVLRDAYGNYIGLASGADWSVDQPSKADGSKFVTAEPRGDASSATVSRHGTTFGNNLYVIVEKDGLSDTVHIKVANQPTASVGPNPFVPGVDIIWDNFAKITTNPNDLRRLEELYGPIVANSKSGKGEGHPENVTGVLVAATAQWPVKQNGGKGDVRYAAAKAVIYDAVGHIVFESGPGDIVIAGEENDNTFGFVWSGKNKAGRIVGPGTYLMRMTATMTNGEKFSSQRMVGVTIRK